MSADLAQHRHVADDTDDMTDCWQPIGLLVQFIVQRLAGQVAAQVEADKAVTP